MENEGSSQNAKKRLAEIAAKAEDISAEDFSSEQWEKLAEHCSYDELRESCLELARKVRAVEENSDDS